MSGGFGNIPVVDPFILLRSGEKLNTPDLSKLSPEEKKAKLKEIAGQFEEVFIETLLKTAREAEKIIKKEEDNYGLNLGFYREMQDYYLSQSIVASGGLGLQDLIVEQLMDKLNLTQNSDNPLKEKKQILKNTKDIKTDLNFHLNFIPPVKGSISSPFGWRIDPFTGKKAYHKGIDIKAPEGTPVHSAEAGKVVFAGEKGGYGNLIILEHKNGFKTYYAHLKDIKVKIGEEVGKGMVIGDVGSTGRSTGPHLHFELRQEDRVYNPLQKLSIFKFYENIPNKRVDNYDKRRIL